MNDIDRSAETFDFALRRLFDWIEIEADEVMESTLKAMRIKDNIVSKIKNMNKIIKGQIGIGKGFKIDSAYFKNYNGKNRGDIWKHNIEPILHEYMRVRQGIDEFIEKCRKYQYFKNNDSRPHGTIDSSHHIHKNMELNNGKIAYNYRRFTANNSVNRLILAIYKRLYEKYSMLCETYINSDYSICSMLKMLESEIGYSKTNVCNIIKENLYPITHSYFQEYKDLRKTCLKILCDENVINILNEYLEKFR